MNNQEQKGEGHAVTLTEKIGPPGLVCPGGACAGQTKR
ncbi:hypothetical protein ACZ87_00001 [Candidatus Erwinia dacicola]|uniref:Uncharacterized protein n=1 Tax=Candidatus Erwinia dacicola TaxID=252393 RepID=A0A328TZH4_9GAMM|nr:hypothetical protein ACZ87_00001 [Candidatus Erwinia dacicola]